MTGNGAIRLIKLFASDAEAGSGNGVEEFEKMDVELGREGGKCRSVLNHVVYDVD